MRLACPCDGGYPKKKTCGVVLTKVGEQKLKTSSPERFELSRGNPMYLAGTRLNHSAKATPLTLYLNLYYSLYFRVKKEQKT